MTKDEAYALLNIKKGSSRNEIKRAFRKLSLKHHPDVEGGSQKAFIRIKEAYDTLINSTQSKSHTSSQQSEPPKAKRKAENVYLRAWVVDFGHPFELVECSLTWHDGDQWLKGTYGVVRHPCINHSHTIVHTRHVDYTLWVTFKNISDVIHPYKPLPHKRGECFNVIEYKEEISFFDYVFGRRVKMPPVGDLLEFSISSWIGGATGDKKVTLSRTGYSIQESFSVDYWMFTRSFNQRYFNTNIQEVRAVYYLNEEKLNYLQKQIVKGIVWISNKIEDKKNAQRAKRTREKDN